ncbi:MAG: hypothetical protein JO011_04170, partial [Ktedonobacteraceae bacterium]|nr:hypothetical protein [Ktedonobacteraceae bacterium]
AAPRPYRSVKIHLTGHDCLGRVRVKWLQTPSPIQCRRGVTLRAPQWLSDGLLGNTGARKVTPLRHCKSMTPTTGLDEH